MLQGAINIAVTVDGFIAGKDGNIDWLNNQPQVEGEDFGFVDFMKSVDVMIMGRNTFDTVVRFGQDMWAYGDLPIVVWTRNVDNVKIPDWLTSKDIQVKASPSPKALFDELQQTPNKKYTKAYVDGGKTIQAFLKAGLIHRMNLTRVPILLGEGIPLFGGEEGMKQQTLKHVSTNSYPNGFVCSVYDVEPASAVAMDES